MSDKPLAAAGERLKGKAGRPRKEKPEVRSDIVSDLPPRLLDLPGAARYLSLSPWTVRDLISNGTLPRVRVPLPNGGELRKILLDRTDLDAFVECAKEEGW